MFAVGGAEVFDDKASMLCHSWQAWSRQNYSGFPACHPVEVSTY